MSREYAMTVVGDGGWGTALAVRLSEVHRHVTLWGAFPDYVRRMARRRENDRFLPGVRLPSRLKLEAELSVAIRGARVIVVAVPSQFYRSVVHRMRGGFDRRAVFVSVAKGLEAHSGMRMTQVLQDELGRVRVAVISGPSHAEEVARHIPTAVAVAGRDLRLAREMASVFEQDDFRLVPGTDPIGLEVGGALKNIVAIAAGISDGLGMGANTKSAILTWGMAEMIALGRVLGARQETFYGLSGIGDLVTTCISPFGRNLRVGRAVGSGQSIRHVLSRMKMVAEGVTNANVAYELSRQHRIRMPLVQMVHDVLHRGCSPRVEILKLFKRKSQ